MMDAPLIITAEVRTRLHKLRDLAASQPTDMQRVIQLLKKPGGKRRHLAQMNRQSLRIPGPWDFFVTFSLETGHPVGTCRHMSMSILRQGRVPSQAGVWMVAEELGFAGGLEACQIWLEDLSDGGKAINVVQPINVQQAVHA